MIRARFLGAPSDWINPRRKRFWAVIGLLSYTLAGFFLVPWIARAQIVAVLSETLHRPVALRELQVNPFVLSAEARGFSIDEPDGTRLIGFDRLFVNFQLSSLFRWAYTFREIELEGPAVELVRLASGDINLSALLPRPEQPEPDRASQAQGPIRLSVGTFALVGGAMEFTDYTRSTTFRMPVGPIDATLHDISTLPGAEGDQQVLVQTDRGTRLVLNGSLQLNPLHSAGSLQASGPYMPLLYLYLQDSLAVVVDEGTAKISFDYDLSLGAGDGLRAAVDNLAFALRDIAVKQEGTAILTLPAVQIRGGSIRYPQQSVTAERLSISAPRVTLWREPDGTLNLARVLASSETPPDEAPIAGAIPDPEAPEAAIARVRPEDWSLHVGQVDLADLQLEFTDRSLDTPGVVEIADLDMTVAGLSNAAGERFPVDVSLAMRTGGRAQFQGDLAVLPAVALDGSLKVVDLQLAVAQSYVGQMAAARIESGSLDLDTTLHIDEREPFGVAGELTVNGLAIVDDAADARLAGWEQVEVDRFTYSTAKNRLKVSQISVLAPFARLVIAADRTNNFQRLLRTPDSQADTDAAEQPPAPGAAANVAAPMKLTIGGVGVRNGSLDFTDRALPLPFSTKVAGLDGTVSTFATGSAEPSQIALQGQIGDYGLARIKGSIMPLGPTDGADIELLFRNVDLPDLSPYTVKFAGRRIADGRMELDLRYALQAGILTAQNRIVISDLQLGEKVDYPDAYDLPLSLAVALLKGPDGKINVDVPVTGDVNDPQFRIGGVIAKAVFNLLTRIVTSPFRLLGSLVGVESENFDLIEWEPGRSTLTPPERGKLGKLAEALALRPQLGLRVRGVMDPVADGAALQVLQTDALIEQQLQAQAAEGAGEVMLSERRRRAIEALYQAAFPESALESLRAGFLRPDDTDAPDGKQVLDVTAYVAELRNQLIGAVTVTGEALQRLADARADAVVQQLMSASQVDAGRLSVEPGTTTTMDKSGWVGMKLEAVSGAVQ